VAQWELFDDGTGRVDAVQVRTFDVGTQVEGCVADDELGYLYIGEEDVGIWKYNAEPSGGTNRTLVDTAAVGGSGHVTPDVEGLAIYYGTNGTGYLIASSQGEGTFDPNLSDSFAVYERQGTNRFLFNFRIVESNGIDAVSMCDGVDVCPLSLGTNYPSGLFVTHDDNNLPGSPSENFKLTRWDSVATASSNLLQINTNWNPRNMGEPVRLTIGVNNTNWGRVSPTGGVYAAGSNVALTATASNYYHFMTWTGDVVSAQNPVTVTMDSNKSVQAVFAENLLTNGTPAWWMAQYGLGTNDAAANDDSDGDGLKNWEEWIAGTVPTQFVSRLVISNLAFQIPNLVITWSAVSGRLYSVYWTTNLLNGFNSNLANDITGGNFTDRNHNAEQSGFYRIRVRIQP